MNTTPVLSQFDDETLAGHFILAGIDQRFADQRALGKEGESRGMIQPGTQDHIERRMRERAKAGKLPGPILAAPED